VTPLIPNQASKHQEGHEHRHNIFRSISNNRQDTNSTQASAVTAATHETHTSCSSAEGRTKQRPQEDWSGVSSQPRSSLSLPVYRENPQVFHWPKPNGVVGDRIDALQMCKYPDVEFRRLMVHRDNTSKSFIYSAVVRSSGGTEERLAVKETRCQLSPDSRKFKETIRKEFDLLASIRHNHIIAAIGSFIDGLPNDLRYGLLLFPLARYNLQYVLEEVSKHNEARTNALVWSGHAENDRLLDYMACLCRAILYLHNLDQPIKHRDVKPQNVLIDDYKNVLLADFDTSKKYTDRGYAITEGPTLSTKRYASSAAIHEEERGLDWDVKSLGYVFLEIASMVLGETMINLERHMKEDPDDELRWDFVRRESIDTWVVRLESVELRTPKRATPKRFRDPQSGTHSMRLSTFLGQIVAMTRATIQNHEDVLEKAWRCFSGTTTKKCCHCHPDVMQTALIV
jgi:hypothetical protein